MARPVSFNANNRRGGGTIAPHVATFHHHHHHHHHHFRPQGFYFGTPASNHHRQLPPPPPSTSQQSQFLSPTSPPPPPPPVKQFKILVNQNRGSGPMPPLTDDKLSNVIEARAGEHRLQYTWTFWYLRFEKNFSWEHSQVDVATFSTVESFWGLFDSLLPLTEAHHGCNYSLFRKGVRPIWEDPMNRHGGRFIFAVNKEEPNYKAFSDAMWLEFCMLIVGHSYPDYCHQICGIVGGNRNNLIKIAVWTMDSHCKQRILKIGQFLKKLVRYDKPVPYEVHMEPSATGPGIGTAAASGGGTPGRTTFKV